MDEQFIFSTSSALFDTYLVYGIIGLLLFIAIIGLIILLATSCCCCYCCLCPKSCCLCYHHNRRHSSYKLRQQLKHKDGSNNGDSKKITFIRRHPSDVADFSQLYDSCPHLINSKAMTTSNTNMDTSCTTIDTFVSPISPCSSFRSFVGSGTSSNDNKLPTVKNDLSNPSQKNNINIDKTNNAPSSSVKGVCSRPFSYIKNTNDRAHILRRFTPHERVIPPTIVSIDVTRISSSENDNNNNQTNSNSTNIYETVLPTTSTTTTTNNNNNNNNNTSTSDIPTPIYETEWTHNLRQLMMATTTSSITNEGISVIKVSSAPPDIVPSIKQTSDYFQQKNPHDKFLANRTTISDSMRRTTMLKQLKDNAAFLY
ncbi:unnamed protein product [Rotaria sordida]|uniref:Uncharacterized protein n=1 Tax=Rotaria sordida TaxID=392033 RepID=A0A814VSI6_9BILA|nr:unnamed protein product [Rotaria sordida]CAF3641341.1 unnamed protein product [Rotaria sordida]